MSGEDSYGVDYCGLPWRSRLMAHFGNRVVTKISKGGRVCVYGLSLWVVCDATKSSASVCCFVFPF